MGSCTITASQAGDANYNPATSVVRTFTINSATQAITFGPAPTGITVGQPLIFVTATSTSASGPPSTLPIVLSSLTPSICSAAGINFAPVNLLAVGTCTIAANQVGDGNYNAAPQATQSFSVAAAGIPPSTFTVTNLNNSGGGSLRAAIASANAAVPGPNIVNFTPGLTGTILLTSGQIQISRAVSIVGPGAANLTINGNANSRIFSIFVINTACPAYEAGPDFLVSISGLRLTNASANFTDSFGGAIYSGRSLMLDSVIIDNSIAKSGGGIGFDVQFAGQVLTITNSQFLNNIAKPVVPPSQFINSTGGALNISQRCGLTILTTPVAVTIANSVFSGNASQPVTFLGRGGAIATSSRADIIISDTRIVGNHVDAPNPPVAGQTYYGGGIHGYAKSWRIERPVIAPARAALTPCTGIK